MSEFKVDAECRSCGGTGLYVGMAEGDGCAVICHTCDGTGCETITLDYKIFNGRNPQKDIKRVFKDSCGIGHGAEDFKKEDGTVIKFSKGGCTYQEFLDGKEPKPVKDLYCPLSFMGQDLRKYPKLKKHCSSRPGCYIPGCKEDKATCWEIWEKDRK